MNLPMIINDKFIFQLKPGARWLSSYLLIFLSSWIVSYCLAEAGATIDEVDHLAINHKLTANLARRLLFTVRSLPRPGYLLDRLSNARALQSIEREVKAEFPGGRFDGRIHHVEHHLAHIASAFWYSPFDTAVALSLDGIGDFASAAWGLGEGNELLLSEQNACPHCGISFPDLSPQLFSFNAPLGMCPDCNGLGTQLKVDPALIVNDPSLSLMDGALRWFGEVRKKKNGGTIPFLQAMAAHYGVDLEQPWQDLPQAFRDALIFGTEGEKVHFNFHHEW
jgi:hypothetical protein